MSRTHDADLCDRIRALEERVAQLEAEKASHVCHGWHYYPQYTVPQWTWTDTGSAATTGFITYDSNTGDARTT